MHRTLADDASAPIHDLVSPARPSTGEFSFPSWIDQWLGQESDNHSFETAGIQLHQRSGRARAFLIAEAPHADALADGDFCQAARQIYACIAEQSRLLAMAHPIRMWNWIPDIHRPTAEGDRYMSFNLGRYEAMRSWFGSELAQHVPAASGVGCEDGPLRVAALLSNEPGRQIENPRQVPAYRYSARFGRLPPCFARATRWKDELFIAGTAAVVGEESQFEGEFDRQLRITLDHLRLMLERGFEPEEIASFTSFRVYLPNQSQRLARAQAVRAALRTLANVTIEIVYADLCRSDLLVEIEAVGQRA